MKLWTPGLLALCLGGCAPLEIPSIDWQSLSESFALREVDARIQPSEIETIRDTRERQEIMQSPQISGVAERLEKHKVIAAEKQQQQVRVEPLVQRLRAMSEQDVLQILGQPTRQIRQGPVLIWQYVAEQCQWDLYFREHPGAKLPALRDLIVHHRGNIITNSAQIARCEEDLLDKPEV